MLDAAIQCKIGTIDCIAFQSSCGVRLGMVVDDGLDTVDVIICKRVTSEISRWYALSPITAVDFPMAYHGNMVEVLANMADKISVPQPSIIDIVFIVPIKEVESGMFHIVGSRQVYFSRYFVTSHGRVRECKSVFYFDHRAIDPFSHRFYH